MGWLDDAWDSFTGAISDAGDTIWNAGSDAVTDTSKAFYSAFKPIGDAYEWMTGGAVNPVPGDNIDDMDEETIAALLSVVPGPWQPFAMAYNLGSGTYDMTQNGVNLQNTLQVAPSAVGAFKGFNAANAAGTSKLAGAGKGAVGLPTTTANTGAVANSADAYSSNPYQAATSDISSGSNFGGDIASMPTNTAAPTGAGATSNLGSSIASMSPTSTSPSLTGAPQIASSGGRNLLEKFGDFTTNRIESSARNQQFQKLADPALNSLVGSPQQGSLFPEGRTPASGYGTEGALSRFNPAASGGYTPIDQGTYDTGIQNLYGAKQNKISSIFQTEPFRGQTPGENSALANQLSKTNLGYDKELGAYNQEMQAENTRRGNQATYDTLAKSNNLTNEQMNKYIGLAGLSDDELASQLRTNRIGNTPEEFRKIFGGLSALI